MSGEQRTCQCGKTFQPAYPRQKNCGRECGQKASRENGGWRGVFLDTNKARAWRSREIKESREGEAR